MFSFSQQRQGLVGIHGFGGGMFAMEEDRPIAEDLPMADDVSLSSLPDEDALSEVASEMSDLDDSTKNIPFERPDNGLDGNSWHNKSHSKLLGDKALDTKLKTIPFEKDMQHVTLPWKSFEDKPKHEFHIESMEEIPFEDGRKVKSTASLVDSNGIPYEHDAMTVVTEDMSSYAESSSSEYMEEEQKEDNLSSLLGDMGIREEKQEDDSSVNSVEALFEELIASGSPKKELASREAKAEENNPMLDDDNADEEMLTEETTDETSETADVATGRPLPGFTAAVEVRPTPSLGKNQYGVFAKEDICYGAMLWKYTSVLETMHYDDLENHIEQNFAKDDLKGIQEFLRRGFPLQVSNSEHFISASAGSFGYVNHSSTPNVHERRATRNIKKGEELTLDYAYFGNPQWYADICHKYGIMSAAEIAKRQESLGEGCFMPADYSGDDEVVFA